MPHVLLLQPYQQKGLKRPDSLKDHYIVGCLGQIRVLLPEAILFSVSSVVFWLLTIMQSLLVLKNALTDKVRNWGFIKGSPLTTKQHVIKICQTVSCVKSRSDYNYSLIMGAPISLIQPFQKVQNSTSRLILSAPRHKRCTALQRQLHWLTVSKRIKYKTDPCVAT